MKPGPLKGKTKTFRRIGKEIPYHEDYDIKSAVEWLKNTIEDYPHPLYERNVFMMIDEAFKDVMNDDD